MFNIQSFLQTTQFNQYIDISRFLRKNVIVAIVATTTLLLMACASTPTSAPAGDSNYSAAPARPAISAAESAAAGSVAQTSRTQRSTGNINDATYDTTFFQDYGVNPFIDTEDDNLSTFAMDVDTASYTVARRFLRDGNMPDPDSIRVEEFINYFKHDYTPPTNGDAFAIHVEGAPSPFGQDTHTLLRVGLQGKVIRPEDRKDVALTFVIDVSGSMDRENRLTLVKRALSMLVEELRPTDSVAIVVYGSNARTVLNTTMSTEQNKNTILNAIHSLAVEGSTNAEAGLRMGYQLAWSNFNPQAINRVILASDGVANVGATGAGSIWEQIAQFAEKGITMTSVGVGMGNYNDVLMEQLANNGDGTYAYVDNIDEARRLFVEVLTGTLQTIAMDAKIQVDFNADVVDSYRLIGYENRDMADDDFRNDEEDAGEVGAGHSVTALYEIKLNGNAQGPLATVRVRYEDPDTTEVNEISHLFSQDELYTTFAASTASFKLDAAVTEYAELLRESYWAKDGDLLDVLTLAEEIEQLYIDNEIEHEDVSEFVDLVDRAERIASRQS